MLFSDLLCFWFIFRNLGCWGKYYRRSLGNTHADCHMCWMSTALTLSSSLIFWLVKVDCMRPCGSCPCVLLQGGQPLPGRTPAPSPLLGFPSCFIQGASGTKARTHIPWIWMNPWERILPYYSEQQQQHHHHMHACWKLWSLEPWQPCWVTFWLLLMLPTCSVCSLKLEKTLDRRWCASSQRFSAKGIVYALRHHAVSDVVRISVPSEDILRSQDDCLKWVGSKKQTGTEWRQMYSE